MDSEVKGRVIVGVVGCLTVFGACAITGSVIGLWGLCLVAVMMAVVG